MKAERRNQYKVKLLHLPPLKTFSDEWFLYKFTEDWTAEDIRYAIDNDLRLDEMLLENAVIRAMLQRVARKKPNENILINFLDLENLLFWFSERRPDLYAELTYDQISRDWLAENLRRVCVILGLRT